MTDFTLHTQTTAPEESKPLLEHSIKAYGMLPNLHATMAEAPGLLEAYKTVGDLFQNSSFDADELTVIWQTINVEHECHYCVPAHTGIAHNMKVDNAIIEALRNETPLPTEHLEALRTFTLQIVRGRGNVVDADVSTFLAAGFSKRQILEVVLGAAHKVMSNYTNHLAQTPVDAPFQQFLWNSKAVAAE